MLILNPNYRFAAVLLAAGASSRMEGEHKLFKTWRGRPLLAHSLATLSALHPLEIILVIRPHDRRYDHFLALDSVTRVINPDPGAGMASSIAAGCRAVPSSIDGIFMCLGDMPAIPPEVFKTLSDAFDPESGTRICVPDCQGLPGHPVLFSSTCMADLLSLEGDVGAYSVIQQHREHVRRIAVNHPGIRLDFDTTADFETETP